MGPLFPLLALFLAGPAAANQPGEPVSVIEIHSENTIYQSLLQLALERYQTAFRYCTTVTLEDNSRRFRCVGDPLGEDEKRDVEGIAKAIYDPDATATAGPKPEEKTKVVITQGFLEDCEEPSDDDPPAPEAGKPLPRDQIADLLAKTAPREDPIGDMIREMDRTRPLVPDVEIRRPRVARGVFPMRARYRGRPAARVDACTALSREICAAYADHNLESFYLTKAVIGREGVWDPFAKRREPDGRESFGLMQVLYDTAKTLGYRGPAEGLYDIDLNLRLGQRYLHNRDARLLTTLSQPEAAAYNVAQLRLAQFNAGTARFRRDGTVISTRQYEKEVFDTAKAMQAACGYASITAACSGR